MMTDMIPARPRFAKLVDQDGEAVRPRAVARPDSGVWEGGDLPPVLPVLPVLTVDGRLMRDLAVKVMASGSAGLVKAGVAGVQHGDGATLIARSLGCCLAEQFGRRVVLVEANARTPSLRAACGLPDGAGLAEVMSGAASLEAVLRVSRSAGKMLVLPASGGLPGGELLARGLEQVSAELFQYADTLIFDLPPVLAYPDAALMGRGLDGVALVMRARRTKRREAGQAAEALAGAGVRVLGAVLNRERRAGWFGRG